MYNFTEGSLFTGSIMCYEIVHDIYNVFSHSPTGETHQKVDFIELLVHVLYDYEHVMWIYGQGKTTLTYYSIYLPCK